MQKYQFLNMVDGVLVAEKELPFTPGVTDIVVFDKKTDPSGHQIMQRRLVLEGDTIKIILLVDSIAEQKRRHDEHMKQMQPPTEPPPEGDAPPAN